MVSLSMDNEELFKTLRLAVQKEQIQGMPRFIPGESMKVNTGIDSFMEQPAMPFLRSFFRFVQGRILIVYPMYPKPCGEGILPAQGLRFPIIV
jgi:hypothetical protein